MNLCGFTVFRFSMDLCGFSYVMLREKLRTYVLEDLNYHRTVDLFLCTITTYRTLLNFFYFQENANKTNLASEETT